MTTQNRYRRLAVVFFATLLVLVASASDAHAATGDPCSCVHYVAVKLFGRPKPLPNSKFSSNPYWMAQTAEGKLARTGKSSVYWAYTGQNNEFHYRYNAGAAQAGDAVIFLKGQPLFVKSGDTWQDASGWVPEDGHIGIVTHARYYAPGEDQSTIRRSGGWEVVVDHANWKVCELSVDTFFVPNGAATGWWRR